MKNLMLGLLFVALAGLVNAEVKNPLADGPTWQELQFDVVGDAPIADGRAVFEVDAPIRANDAAIVPIVIQQTDPNVKITQATIVIDENPSPVVAVMDFGPSMGQLDMELRVRVDQYSNVRVIADTEQGLLMNGRFVKASGGCSAPATKDLDAAQANIGKMRLKHFASEPLAGAMSIPRRQAQIMIRHPNYSGLQRNQITQLFVPPQFIDAMEVYQGDDLLFSLEGGISISEDPVFRFSYNDNGEPDLRVRVQDTDGNVFEQLLSKDGAA